MTSVCSRFKAGALLLCLSVSALSAEPEQTLTQAPAATTVGVVSVAQGEPVAVEVHEPAGTTVAFVPTVPVVRITVESVDQAGAFLTTLIKRKKRNKNIATALLVTAGAGLLAWKFAPNSCLPKFLRSTPVADPVQPVLGDTVPLKLDRLLAHMGPIVPHEAPATGVLQKTGNWVAGAAAGAFHMAFTGVFLTAGAWGLSQLSGPVTRAYRSTDIAWAFNEYAALWPSIDALLHTCAIFDPKSSLFSAINRIVIQGEVQTLDPQDVLLLQGMGMIGKIAGNWQLNVDSAAGSIADKLVQLRLAAATNDAKFDPNRLIHAWNDYAVRLNMCMGYLKSKSEILTIPASRRVRMRAYVDACMNEANQIATLVESTVAHTTPGQRPTTSDGLLSTCWQHTRQIADMYSSLTRDPEFAHKAI